MRQCGNVVLEKKKKEGMQVVNPDINSQGYNVTLILSTILSHLLQYLKQHLEMFINDWCFSYLYTVLLKGRLKFLII